MMQKMKEQDQTKSTNIKWHNLTIDREKLEKMRGHKGMVIWFTGLSGSGKSTLANALNEQSFTLRWFFDLCVGWR